MFLKKLMIPVVLLLIGLLFVSSKSADAQLVVGNDKTPASQHVVYWNTSESDNFFQITNTSGLSTWVHFQTFDSEIGCVESNEFLCLTGGDTEILSNTSGNSLLTNDNSEGFTSIFAVVSVLNEDGEVVCPQEPEITTPLPTSVVPRDFDHLISSHWIVGEDTDAPNAQDAVMYNGIGRSLNSSNQFDFIQPAFITVPFTDDIAEDDFNFITVAWTDVYSPTNAYEAETGTVTAIGTDDLPFGRFVIDDNEFPRSCSDLEASCAICRGIHPGDVEESNHICSIADRDGLPDNDNRGDDPDGSLFDFEFDCDRGGLPLDGLTSFLGVIVDQNVFNLMGSEDTNDFAGISHAIHISEIGAVGPPPDPPVEVCGDADNPVPASCFGNTLCNDDPQCGGNQLGEVPGGQAGANCNDFDDDGVPIDNDGNGQANCADIKCNGVVVLDADGQQLAVCEHGGELSCEDDFDNDGNGQTDCIDAFCILLDICVPRTVDSSSGCSVAAATTGLGSMANALVLLIPAFGIGVRRIRRRLSK